MHCSAAEPWPRLCARLCAGELRGRRTEAARFSCKMKHSEIHRYSERHAGRDGQPLHGRRQKNSQDAIIIKISLVTRGMPALILPTLINSKSSSRRMILLAMETLLSAFGGRSFPLLHVTSEGIIHRKHSS